MDNIKLGEQLKERGMQLAVDHADRVEKSWSDRALAGIRAMSIMNETFTTEAAVQWATSRGLPEAPDPRAWGSVVRRAVIAGWIAPSHYEKSSNPKAHRRPVQVWKSNKYRRV